MHKTIKILKNASTLNLSSLWPELKIVFKQFKSTF